MLESVKHSFCFSAHAGVCFCGLHCAVLSDHGLVPLHSAAIHKSKGLHSTAPLYNAPHKREEQSTEKPGIFKPSNFRLKC